jgi:hypothetical protein
MTEFLEDGENILLDQAPKRLIKTGAKTIRSRALVSWDRFDCIVKICF